MGFTLSQMSPGDRSSSGTGGPHPATTSDPSYTVLGPASTVTPWLWSHRCGAPPHTPSSSPRAGMGV